MTDEIARLSAGKIDNKRTRCLCLGSKGEPARMQPGKWAVRCELGSGPRL